MFQIDSMSRKPVYEQIIEQVESFLLNDILKPGDQIPSVRNVTMQYAINPRTVLKAYNDLDARGLIRSVPGKGYFVCEEAKQILNQRHMERLQELTEIQPFSISQFSERNAENPQIVWLVDWQES